MSLRAVIACGRLGSMKASFIPMPYIPHQDKKAQKLKERVLRMLAAKAQPNLPIVRKPHRTASVYFASRLAEETKIPDYGAFFSAELRLLTFGLTTMARTRTGLVATVLFFSGATMTSDPETGSVASGAEPSTT